MSSEMTTEMQPTGCSVRRSVPADTTGHSGRLAGAARPSRQSKSWNG